MVPGVHNIYNALSAISICLEIDIPIKYIEKTKITHTTPSFFLEKFCPQHLC